MTPEDVVVVRGAPDDDELAALVAALALLAARPRAVPPAGKAPAWVRESFTAPGSWARG
ncbi:acyl-CoA carboxylase epsilon subunit [Amycolatopsis sp. cmx-4-61]|uniref:acyl-CoA carboxylase epsilon subunit n=1 Tax=Amycolatopsis sp. cmx-4-61 TaxID=2790937 RepID=UPI00397CE5A8